MLLLTNPHGISNKPHGTSNKPHGISNKPHGTSNKPHGGCSMALSIELSFQVISQERRPPLNHYLLAKLSIYILPFKLHLIAVYLYTPSYLVYKMQPFE